MLARLFSALFLKLTDSKIKTEYFQEKGLEILLLCNTDFVRLISI